MGWESADGSAGGLSREADADGGWGDGLKAKTVGEDDAIVENVVDVGLGGEAAEGGGVVR